MGQMCCGGHVQDHYISEKAFIQMRLCESILLS